ncbi:MAG TPA: hydantoinase/oxoprolinase family protein [Gaiellales bacterium]|nr:hydantoinase/oxoprolinase family protein [Gaiellales bacterium]
MTGTIDLRLGIDVGGTNTDAVVLDRAGALVAKAKRATTADVTGGITAAIDAVVADPAVEPGRITHVMLGTTHATNALLERRRLERVAAVRIGAPSTTAIPPLYDWPPDLREAVSAGAVIVRGGFEFHGAEIVPLDGDELRRFLHGVADTANAVALTSVFASVSDEHELAAAEIVHQELGPDVPVSLSREIGSIGLLERENATVMNAALRTVATEVAEALTRALEAHDLRPVVLFAQNDGTLMALEYAVRHPVLTIGSGPANSIRGAAYLTGATDTLVADVGGTSTDIGVLVNGFPRESSAAVEIGGVRTNFRMPDLVAIALGGGTIVEDGDGTARVGPSSVGYSLPERALVFGGDTATLTDAAVAGGRLELGDAGAVGQRRGLLEEALRRSDEMLAEAIDRVKTARGDSPLVVVGGGSPLVPDRLPGVSETVRPPHHDVANAIGAAIASVSGQIDRIYEHGPGGRTEMLDAARQAAHDEAVRAGADPAAVEIVALEELPLAYLTTPTVRIRAKAAGPLA